jgi:hypothetical protein
MACANLAYYVLLSQSEQYQLAMSAAYTYHVAHPNHAYMGNNVDYYSSMPQGDPSFFVDLEAKSYQVNSFVGEI